VEWIDILIFGFFASVWVVTLSYYLQIKMSKEAEEESKKLDS
jgi:hypothetical protein